MNSVEEWAKQINKSISGITPSIAEDGYPTGAGAIVEPWAIEHDQEHQEAFQMHLLAYYAWAENAPEQWASWIRQTFGDAWGNIADQVNIEGY